MEWIEFLKTFGFTTAGQILLLIVIGFWGKKMIEYFFGKTIELKKMELGQELQLHKHKLEQENNILKLNIDKNFETYRNELEILKLEYQVLFSKLHEKRSLVIETLYQKLVRLNTAMLDLTVFMRPIINDPDKEEKERLVKANDAFSDFQKYYSETKIYFYPETCYIIDKLKKHFWECGWDYTKSSRRNNESELNDSYKKAIGAGDIVREEIPKVLELLENDFRQMLGVTKIKKNE